MRCVGGGGWGERWGKPCELYCGGECVLLMFSQVMLDMVQVGAVDIPAIQWPSLSLCVCVCVCVHTLKAQL